MDFNEQNLKSLQFGKDIGCPIYFFSETESTNAEAMRLAEEGASEGTAVVADSQTRGRGRLRNRDWQSPPGVNIYTSIILRPPIDAAQTSPITLTASIAVAELFSSYCPGMVAVKWPNDVLINGKKACGILAEIKTVGKKAIFIILGIGLNVNMKKEDLLPQLQETATSLREETGVCISRLNVTNELYMRLGGFYRLFLREGFGGGIRDLWQAYAEILGKDVAVTFGEEIVMGRAEGIDEVGALILRDKQGIERRVIAGDIAMV